MEISLDKEIESTIKANINSAFKVIVKKVENEQPQPYLNRKEIAKYFGVAESTISYWVNELGCPYADIDGRKLYGKESITKWLASHEKSAKK